MRVEEPEHHRPVAPIDLLRHEVMSPISVMAGAVDILQHSLDDLDEARRDELFAVLRRQLRLLGGIVGRLDVLRDLEDEQVALDREEVDVAAVVRLLVSDLDHGGAPVPVMRVQATGPTTALADLTALQEILVNLLTNAVRYGDGAPIDVTVTARGEAIETRVRDHGPGVTDLDRDHIFDPYVRGGHHSPGLGIGLALGRGLAEAQGGALHLRPPASGTGCVFVLSLPRVDPPA